ncbi:MAG: undecaprenyl-phosphate glucose phosphotransferase [Bacteroidota bacterium]|nr:undecaprenyl-phosphate glucose phosphotransferase [Bacteroidota bacterium]
MLHKQNNYTGIRYMIDAPIVVICFILASLLSLGESLVQDGRFLIQCFIALVVWYLCSSFSRLYADRRSNKYSEEIIFIIYTLLVYAITLSSVFFFLREPLKLEHSNNFFGILLLLLFVFLTLTKYIIRKYLHSAIYQGKLLDNMLIVGATPSAFEFYETVNRYYYYGYKCIGFLDNHTQKMNGCMYRGKIKDLSVVLKEQPVDEVVIALPATQNDQIRDCVEVCDYHRIKARIIPDFQQYTSATAQVNNIGLLSVINVRPLPLDRTEFKILKRAFDFLFALVFFTTIGIILLPLIAIFIKLTSKGPAFFKQERWGLNNEKIICYKFRTMVISSRDVDENGAYQQATRNDHRVTKVGAFLRRTNLDELPQFWNVLVGNMSVVGPRPHPTPLNLESMHTIDNYMLRHVIKPGITGWAQVNGSRGETKSPGDMQQRVNFDLYYIHRWTFWLDCQIILQTMINMMRGDQNAY